VRILGVYKILVHSEHELGGHRAGGQQSSPPFWRREYVKMATRQTRQKLNTRVGDRESKLGVVDRLLVQGRLRRGEVDVLVACPLSPIRILSSPCLSCPYTSIFIAATFVLNDPPGLPPPSSFCPVGSVFPYLTKSALLSAKYNRFLLSEFIGYAPLVV
jgi:hypothetical protein